MKYVPSLDKNFQPLILKFRAFEEAVEKAENQELTICLERHLGYNYIRTVKIFKDGTGHDEENYQMIERIVKSMLWVVGGFKFYFKGSKYIYERIKADYSKDGARAFDADFMANVYENDFEVYEEVEHDDDDNHHNQRYEYGGYGATCRVAKVVNLGAE